MFTLNCKGRLLVLDKPVIMGIINVTPDSFYGKSRVSGVDSILNRAEEMLEEGAVILDVGGQSTRPGSQKISVEEELSRVIGPISAICKRFPEAFISIDTYYSQVAKEAVNAGASVINDISSGNFDKSMISVVAALEVPYILMHIKGTPETMQQYPKYDNVTTEVLDFFIQKTEELKQAGISDIILDPGFGFGKTISHNFELLRHFSVFKAAGKPLLAGISRKSTIYKTLGITAEEALNGTTVLQTIALLNGANILRTHDIKEARETIVLLEEYEKIKK